MYDLMLRAYKASDAMEPIAMLDYYVKIIAKTGTYYRKVTWFERIPPFQVIDTQAVAPRGPLAVAAPLAAGAQGQKSNLINLGLWVGEFGQWRWFPLDNAQVRLYLPSGDAKWSLKNLQVGLDRSIIYRDPLLLSTEMNTWEEEYAAVEPVNFSAYALTAVRIIAMGYRYHTEPVTEPPLRIYNSPTGTLKALEEGARPCTPVICTGLSMSGK